MMDHDLSDSTYIYVGSLLDKRRRGGVVYDKTLRLIFEILLEWT